MQGSNLLVDGVELCAVFLDERCRPFLDEGYMFEDVHGAKRQPLPIPCDEKPYPYEAERANDGQHRCHEHAHVLREDEEEDGNEPKPEVAEDVRHGIEDDRRRCPLSPDFRSQFHDAIWLAPHQSTGCGIIEGESTDGDFIKPPKGNFLGVGIFARLDDEIPCRRVEDIEHRPEGEDGKEPIPRMFQPLPCLGKVELRHHDGQHDDAKGKKHVLVFFLHQVILQQKPLFFFDAVFVFLGDGETDFLTLVSLLVVELGQGVCVWLIVHDAVAGNVDGGEDGLPK